MRFKVGVLTISDRAYAGVYEDRSGPALAGEVQKRGWDVARTAVIPDLAEVIEATLINWSDQKGFDVILTTGGTGLGSRDVTPEATRRVLAKELPGIGEIMRIEGLVITPLSILSRAVAGSRGKTLIVNLPGSPEGAVDSLRAVADIFPHALAMLHGEAHAHQREEGVLHDQR
ncbi:MAG: MogA/MoaB family molybdenum cofactor biosynthesis protein [Elusimicrobia bacterium]|nr:MogA/MoaB family molybdenum cofactor biosynthesis protein [Elusimicrobiota bacterium]